MGKNTLSSRPFWKKINRFRSKKCSKQIPSLLKDGIEFKTDIDKGKIFGNILASTFSPHLDLVESEDSSEISQTITDFFKKKVQNNLDEPITLLEIRNAKSLQNSNYNHDAQENISHSKP
ncbi:hypothetical protein BpHYR1_022297 [Brachionus plicatilis]|uniref:Uncharacterized protein n=1 Tax=Brachionus plicatilis TaxID=10195 RepID=A0A3M7R1J5_BRAPC|nr:hypothetical protein BpHYR1_022297 [Brachionus plicatilis]